jgi:nucleoside-diphosphate-sugar epimerase
MRVLITGGAGHIGKATTERLVQNGWDVRVIGIESGIEIEGAENIQCDILNYDDVLNRMRGCEAVIHLAAIRSPIMAPGHELFQVNVAGTFNVFEAAAATGIRRVVQASSINALGCFYGTGDIKAEYFPIDEEHPSFTTDPYSFSKQVVEDIGDYYWRREGISSVALRLPGVYLRGYTLTDGYHQRREMGRKLLDELASQTESEQQARIAEARQRALEYRSQRPFEFNPAHPEMAWPNVPDDPLFRAYAIDRFNLWAFVDQRDAAQSLEKGLTADYEGAHALFINDHLNSLGYDSRTLVRLFFPEISETQNYLSGAASLVSIEKARTLIGFEPEYSIEKLEQP